MMKEVGKLKSLKQISPSKYTSLKNCTYRTVLANLGTKQILPYSPSSHLGTIIHECLNLIFSNEIYEINQFSKKWDELVEKEEESLRRKGLSLYIPLSKNVQGYTIKKLQVKSILKKKISKENFEDKSTRKPYKIYTEKWLESADGLIAGKADFIFNSDSYSKLSDFKTGNILNEGTIKKDFEDQLNLYAYLFKENFGKYPDALSLIDLQNNEHFIPISEEKCETLAQEAKSYLNWVNQCISDVRIDKIANPNEEICSSCLFRPACEFYWRNKNYDSESKFDDVKGLLVEVKKFKNGNINITINQNNQDILIYRIKDIFEEFLLDSLKKEVAVYNLKKVNTLTYQAIKTTKIYYAEY